MYLPRSSSLTVDMYEIENGTFGEPMTMKSAMTALVGLAVLLSCYVTGDDALAASRGLMSDYSSDLIPRRAAEKMQPMAVHPEAMVSHVVVKFAEPSRARLRSGRLVSGAGLSLSAAETALQPYFDGRFERLFAGFSEAKLDRDKEVLQRRSGHELADLNSYYRIDVTEPGAAEQPETPEQETP